MKITKISLFTGVIHTMDIDIDDVRWEIWNGPNPPVVQKLFPELSDDEREFLISGCTPEEWDALYGDAADEDVVEMNESAF